MPRVNLIESWSVNSVTNFIRGLRRAPELRFAAEFTSRKSIHANAAPTRDQDFRGVYWKVVQAGEASVGASIRVLARPR
jgi:MOSC domain-containing protein YiiM